MIHSTNTWVLFASANTFLLPVSLYFIFGVNHNLLFINCHCWKLKVFLISHSYINAAINMNPIAYVFDKFLEQNLGTCLRV